MTVSTKILEQRKRDKERYARRRAALLCGWCEAPNTPRSLCDDCLVKNKQRIRTRHSRRRKNSQCGYCGVKVSAKYTQCAKCRKIHQRSRIDNYKKGLCRCGAERHPGKKFCSQCLIKFRKFRLDRIARHKVLGLCTVCSSPQLKGHVFCQKHRLEKLAAHRDYYKRLGKQKRKDKIAAGICVRCPAKSVGGTQYCAPHREIMRLKSKMYYKKRHGNN